MSEKNIYCINIKINSVSIQSGVINVNMVTQGMNDPMPRPTLQMTRTFILQGEMLIE